IAAGRGFATVGLSQLTTSRRHGARALRAGEPDGTGVVRVDGVIPWVTAAARADVLVIGAVHDDGRQVLAAVPSGRPGPTGRPPRVRPGRAPGGVPRGGRRRGSPPRPGGDPGGPVARRPRPAGRGGQGRAGALGAGAGTTPRGPRRARGRSPPPRRPGRAGR